MPEHKHLMIGLNKLIVKTKSMQLIRVLMRKCNLNELMQHINFLQANYPNH